MQIVICDRCGKKLFSKGRGVWRGEFYSHRGGFGVLEVLLGEKWNEIDYDLCEDCAKELKEWLSMNDKKDGDA